MGKATSCMKSKESYSDGCASCFGALIHCTASKCMGKCMFGQSAACTECVKDNCESSATACSGITPPSLALYVPAGGACTNAADQQVWTSKGKANFDADMNACGNPLGETNRKPHHA